MVRRLLPLGAVAVLVFGGVPSAQTLTELAKKAEAERAAKEAKENPSEKAATPKKAFSNKDLDSRGDGTEAPPVDIPKRAEVVANAPKGSISAEKFEGVYRAAKSIEGATGTGVTYLRFRELLQGLSTELSILADHRPFT